MIRILLLLALAATPALAHDALTGWAYGTDCCSLEDCHATPKPVRATSTGWFVTETGETIPYGDDSLRKSGDDDFHVCKRKPPIVQGVRRTICLYVPPWSF